MRALGPTIRSRLLLLVFVATLPLLAFSTVLLVHAYRVNAGLFEDTSLSTARRLAASIDAQLARAEAIGYAVSEMPVGSLTGAAGFEEIATHILETTKLDGRVQVLDRDGNVVARTTRADQAPASGIADLAVVRRVFETAQPQIAGVRIGATSRQAQVSVHVPLIRAGEVRYDVVVEPRARSIGDTGPDRLPDHWFTVVADADGRVIGDSSVASSDEGSDTGQLPPAAAALFARGRDGFAKVAYRNGVPVLLGFTHTTRTDWTVAAGIPEAIVRGPLIRSVGALAAGGTLVLLLGLALAWRIGRSIIDPLSRLARSATQLDELSRLQDEQWGGLSDVQAVARALSETTTSLHHRERDREAALRRAETSEARLLLAQEVGDIGTWQFDIASGRREWSQGEYKLYGLDPKAGPPSNEAVMELIHPSDRDAVKAARAHALEAPTTFRILYRITHANGAVRWLRAAGRSEFDDGKPVRLIGSTIDVTERQEAERTLRQSATRLEGEVADQRRVLDQSEQRFRTYFEYSSDALLIVRHGPDGFVYEMANKTAEHLFGLSSEQIIGRRPDEIFPPETAYEKECRLSPGHRTRWREAYAAAHARLPNRHASSRDRSGRPARREQLSNRPRDQRQPRPHRAPPTGGPAAARAAARSGRPTYRRRRARL